LYLRNVHAFDRLKEEYLIKLDFNNLEKTREKRKKIAPAREKMMDIPVKGCGPFYNVNKKGMADIKRERVPKR